MPWARIDDEFDDHPKVLALLEHEQGAAAIGLWTLCLSWAYRNTLKRGKTPGLLPASLPRRYVGPAARDLTALLAQPPAGFTCGLWEPLASGELMIHDLGDYLPSDKTREARAAAGRRGAASRWAGRAANGEAPGTDGKLPSDRGNEPGACHDADSNAVANDGSRARARRGSVVGSTGSTPVPGPAQQPPASVAAASESRLSVTQRSKRITDAYTVAEPMCNWPAVNGVVIKAIKAERFSDDEIRAALLRMAAENRSVTVDSLRTELAGLPPRDTGGRSTTNSRVAQAQALKARMRHGAPAPPPPNTIPGSVIR